MIVRRLLVALLVGSALLVACGVEEEDPDLGTVTPAVQSWNNLAPDDLVGCRADAAAALTQRFGQSPVTSRMVSTARCMKVLQYMFHCAASPAQTAKIKDLSGNFVVFPSRDPAVAPQTPALALAPIWLNGAMTAAQREAVAGCTGAHLNNRGARVAIVLNGPDYPPLTNNELTTNAFVEGTIMSDVEFAPVRGCVSAMLRAACPLTAEKTMKETRCLIGGGCDNFRVIGDCPKVCATTEPYASGCSDGVHTFTHGTTARLAAAPKCAAP